MQEDVAKLVKKAVADALSGVAAEPAPAPEPPPFKKTKSGAAILRWLQASGFQIEKSQFYDHIKEGKLATDKQGMFTVRRVKKYAKTFLRRMETGQLDREEKEDLATTKAQEEIKRLRLQNKREELKLAVDQGQYLPKDDFYRELAARLVVLDAGLERMARDRVTEFVHIVGGDQAKAEHLTASLVAAKNELLNSYASTQSYHVLIMPSKQEGQAAVNEEQAP